jgi:hypothetical protein
MTFGEPTFLVFNSAEEMLRAYAAPSCIPRRVFQDHVVLAFHRGFCRTGGHFVRILSLAREGGEVTVRVQYSDPKPGDFVTLVFTYPFDMVQIPRSSLRRDDGRKDLLFRVVDSGGREVCRREVSID